MNKTTKAAFIIVIISLLLSGVSLGITLYNTLNRAAPAAASDIQYVMYLGTNDKDTYEPVCAPEEAKKRLDQVLTKHFEGFTIQEAQGGWTNEDGTVSHEYTLVIYLSDTTVDKVRAAADDLIKEFNQSSVLIQANETTTEFYAGA